MSFDKQGAVEANLASCQCHDSCMVGVNSAKRDDAVRVFLHCICQDKLGLTSLEWYRDTNH